MALNFPNVADIHLARSPLREVVCQVRFPPILRIAHEEPVEMQEHLRSRFPLLDVEQGVAFTTEGIKPRAQVASSHVYRFYNANKTATISLSADFYAFSTTNYQDWAGFANNLACASEAVREIYQPAYATRIGLRYINILDVSFTESGTLTELLALLRSELTVMLQTEAIQTPELAIQQIESLVNEGQFNFRHGLIREDKEPKLLLDFDHYAEGNLSLEDLLERCDRYHKMIYNAFRWCIAPDRLAFFQPKEQ